jgi:hypothetical protein
VNRQTASTVLAIVGSALALIGGVALYLRAEVFDADRFADNAAQVLQDDEAREALTDPIVDQAVTSGPDQLINGQPILRTAVSGVLESSAFAKLFKTAVAKVYRGLFTKDREEIPLTLNNVDVLVTDAVANFNPKIADKIPRNVGNKVLKVTENEAVLTAVRVSEDVKVLGFVLPFVSLLCFGGAFALAPDRRKTLMVSGIALAAAAAVGLIALLIGRNLVLSQFDSGESAYAAVDALWDAMLGGLRTWMIAAGAIALILTAAAATAREVDPTAPARRALAIATVKPEKPAWVLVRAALIALVSLWFILDPLEALKVVAVIVGGYGVFYAACEALALIAPAPSDRRRRVARSPRQLAIGAGALAAAVLLVAVVHSIVTGDDDAKAVATRPAGPTERCNGFKQLCDRPFNEVALPGAHNAMSAAELPGWYTPNQRRGIQTQLDDGIRALLIDSHYGIARSKGPVLTDFSKEDRSKILESVEAELGPSAVPAFQSISAQYATRGGEGKPGPYLCHVVCELGSIELVRSLEWVRDFLDTHPDEVVMLFIEDKVSPEDTAPAFKASGLLRYAYEYPTGEEYPTLREMIEANKRLFVMAEEDNGGGEYPWYHAGFELAQETPYTFDSPDALEVKASCDPNRGEPQNLLFQLNHWVEKVPRSPDTAAVVNDPEFLISRARRCEKIRGRIPNIVAVDYYDQGDVVEAAQVLNGIPLNEKPRYRETD